LREVPVATGAAVAAAGAAAAGAHGRVVVNVARGQSLDALLKQHLAASPLRVEVLRELVRQLNPQAFAPGNGLRLLAGARLQLPSLQDQAQHAFGKVLTASTATSQADAADRGGPSATAGARMGWVRYP
jgi:Tfp pilus assembly protein FimV